MDYDGESMGLILNEFGTEDIFRGEKLPIFLMGEKAHSSIELWLGIELPFTTMTRKDPTS